MKQISWFSYYFGGWIWLIRYKIANFVIGYNIEEALEAHYEVGLIEQRLELFDNLNRVTLVDDDRGGIQYERHGIHVDSSVQDDGKTLKLFIKE